MTAQQQKHISAFTLVELSIAIIIIGLIVAGVLGARSLIETAKLNSLVSDLNKYQTAVKAFHLEYDTIPGDMREAPNYWSDTLNGDGDGSVEWGRESFQFWLHLSRAEIINGDFSGAVHGAELSVPGINVPYTPIDKGVYVPFQAESLTSPGARFNGAGIDVLCFGSVVFGSCSCCAGALTPKQMKYVDKKIDDANPIKGKLGVYPFNQCYTGEAYNLSSSRDGCAFNIRMNYDL